MHDTFQTRDKKLTVANGEKNFIWEIKYHFPGRLVGDGNFFIQNSQGTTTSGVRSNIISVY